MKNKTVDRGFILTLTLGIFSAVSILTLGLFHEWTSCAASVLLSVWLFAKAICDKEFSFNINLTFISIVLFVLMYGITLYRDAGDKESVEICKKQLVFTKQKYENNIQRVSGLGLKIKDKPETEFPEDIETYISDLQSE